MTVTRAGRDAEVTTADVVSGAVAEGLVALPQLEQTLNLARSFYHSGCSRLQPLIASLGK